jgi:methionyl aminopeptidase
MKSPILKSRDEIAVMERANRIVLDTLARLREMVRPGVTTEDLNAVAEEELAKHGAESPFKGYAPLGLPAYPAVVCSSVDDVIVHGIPNREPLREGSILGLDFGSILDGFVGDGAITVGVGRVSAEAEKLMTVTRECLDLAIEEMRPGRRLGDIGAAVQEHAEANDFHVIRTFVGHGIGRKMHEDPQVYNYGTRGMGLKLVEGMVLAIEPMLCEIGPELGKRLKKSNDGMVRDVRTDADGWTARTLDGARAAHFEHSVAVTANGPVILGRGEI